MTEDLTATMYQAHDAINASPVGVKQKGFWMAKLDADTYKIITRREAYVLKMEVAYKTG